MGKGALRPASPLRLSPMGTASGARTLTASRNLQGKVLLVLYDVSIPSPHTFRVAVSVAN